MFTVIRCKNCEGTNGLSVRLSFTMKFECCARCGHMDDPKWNFDFCDLKCLFEWLKKNEVEKNGFPCQDCSMHGKPTGFSAGFRENGICETCHGKKTVKKVKMILPKGRVLGK